jgi:hypothetical protein
LKPVLSFFLAALLQGCAGERPVIAPPEKGYGLSGRDPFRFEVDAELLRRWGGAGSEQFNRTLEEELERQQICRGGYALRNAQLRDGVYTVTGRCKS